MDFNKRLLCKYLGVFLFLRTQWFSIRCETWSTWTETRTEISILIIASHSWNFWQRFVVPALGQWFSISSLVFRRTNCDLKNDKARLEGVLLSDSFLNDCFSFNESQIRNLKIEPESLLFHCRA